MHLDQDVKGASLFEGMIAVMAFHHDLTVVTRNTRGFRRAGVRVLDPFLSNKRPNGG